jgi:adenosylhomocysteine nucleosidase
VTGGNGGGIVVLFALEREAAPFRRVAAGLKNLHIHVTGVGRKRARLALERILAESLTPSLLIAAGFCGALKPTLKVGDVVVASEVIDQSGRSWPVTGKCNLLDQQSGRLITVHHLVATTAEKQRLGESHQADAVDMESAAAAEVCEARGAPFLAVRAVSDAVDTELSPELVHLLSGGRVSVWKAIRALVKKPSLLREFRRLARDTKVAAKNLAETVAKIVREKR